MSDQGKKDVLQSLASLLECPICLEPFKDPRMLPGCFHSLCYQCLARHVETTGGHGQFLCPVCRSVLRVPKSGTDSFPKNFFMNTCLSVVTDSTTGARSKTTKATSKPHSAASAKCCNTDESDDCSAAVYFCVDCGEYYCDDCSKAHRKYKAIRNHVQVPVDKVTDEMLGQASMKSGAPNCQRHDDEKMKLYCITCQCAVCYLCSQTSHQSHKFQDMSSIDNDLKKQLEETKTTLNNMAASEKRAIFGMNVSKQRFDKSIADAKRTTQVIFNQMQAALDQVAANFSQKIKESQEDGVSKFAIQSKNRQLHLGLLESLGSYVDDLLQKGSVYNRLATMPEVCTHVHNLRSSPNLSTDFPAVDVPRSEDLMEDIVAGLKTTTCKVNEGFQIFVNNPKGRIITLNVKLYDLIGDIKSKIRQKVGIPLEQHLILIFIGKQLSDDLTVLDYGIQKESTLDLTLQLLVHGQQPGLRKLYVRTQ